MRTRLPSRLWSWDLTFGHQRKLSQEVIGQEYAKLHNGEFLTDTEGLELVQLLTVLICAYLHNSRLRKYALRYFKTTGGSN